MGTRHGQPFPRGRCPNPGGQSTNPRGPRKRAVERVQIYAFELVDALLAIGLNNVPRRILRGGRWVAVKQPTVGDQLRAIRFLIEFAYGKPGIQAEEPVSHADEQRREEEQLASRLAEIVPIERALETMRELQSDDEIIEEHNPHVERKVS
jgi:hypothetical protein